MKLRRIKAKYDPNSRFSFAQMIPTLTWHESQIHLIYVSIGFACVTFSVLLIVVAISHLWSWKEEYSNIRITPYDY